MNNEKKYFLNVLKSIAYSLLITVPVYFIVLMLILLVFFGDGDAEAPIILPKLIMIAVYFVVLYFVHIKQSAEFSKIKVKGERYNFKADALEYIKTEGKYQLVLYAVITVLFELLMHSGGDNGVIAAGFVAMCVPTVWLVEAPVLRAAVGYIAEMVILFVITLVQRCVAHKRALKKVIVFGEVEREKEINYNRLSVEDRMKKWGWGDINKHI